MATLKNQGSEITRLERVRDRAWRDTAMCFTYSWRTNGRVLVREGHGKWRVVVGFERGSPVRAWAFCALARAAGAEIVSACRVDVAAQLDDLDGVKAALAAEAARLRWTGDGNAAEFASRMADAESIDALVSRVDCAICEAQNKRLDDVMRKAVAP